VEWTGFHGILNRVTDTLSKSQILIPQLNMICFIETIENNQLKLVLYRQMRLLLNGISYTGMV